MSSRSRRSRKPRDKPTSPQKVKVEEDVVSPSKRKIDVFHDLKHHSNRKVIALDPNWQLDPNQQKLLKQSAPVNQTPHRKSVEETIGENWDWFYIASGIRWELTDYSEMENLKSSFTFNFKKLTGKQVRVSAQTLRRDTSRSIQFKICSYGVADGRMVPFPMVTITIEHYRRTRATFQFNLLDPKLAKKNGIELELLMRICGIVFKFEDALVRRTPDHELMDVVEDVIEGVIMDVEEKMELEERKAAELGIAGIGQIHDFSDQSPISRLKPNRMISLPDRCTIL